MSSKLTDGSRLIVEGAAQAGIQAYSGYPITPVNRIYSFAVERIPQVLKAPDEISALQWASGFAATGKTVMTGTSRPGFSLMTETVDMAFMMELPIMIALAQRLGPSTGSATTGAQGDLGALDQLISGGYSLPVLCPANLEDCFQMSAEALRIAVELRTPVVLLTSKEMIETERSMNTEKLPEVPTTKIHYYEGEDYLPYRPKENKVPSFLPVGNEKGQVRLTASTHDQSGELKKTTPEAMNNTKRLSEKIRENLEDYLHYKLDHQEGARKLIISYGISSYAATEATESLRAQGHSASLLLIKTLLPVSQEILDILDRYDQLVFVEENLHGQYKKILFGAAEKQKIKSINSIGRMITPEEIIEEVAPNEL
ncbi:MAG: transketolase C-terminal domain-containing protein [Candidatus Acetothermia bacterium]